MMYPFYSLDCESPSSFQDIEDNEAVVDLSYPGREPDNGVDIVGSCNGLICLLYLPDCFILWNPTIKESKELPSPPFAPSYGDLCFKGFGYNSSIDDYKVVRAPSANANPNQLRVEVFSLKANSWTRIEDLNSLVVEDGYLGRLLHLVEPYNQESKELPIPPFSPFYDDLSFNGFGYNSSIDDYKVVNANPNQFGVEVFSLEANSWRKIEDLKSSLVIEEGDVGSCLNGALHWLGSSGIGPNRKGVIVSLDLGTEKFWEMSIPDCDKKNSNISFGTLGIINGCLSLLSNEGGSRDVGIQ
ncbi:hypothetical protein Vadar_033346 [Vaccinium darrowii]|uniref:Uncharacterized protein n=1 Tax=Vaccinium darrowii TaxID=229202 RepID=A0ACB7X6K2_9ERIC|nr:hypothetical protein Vadar_033346 [Vaccinium darrowii]